jgi:hypothetical protein
MASAPLPDDVLAKPSPAPRASIRHSAGWSNPKDLAAEAARAVKKAGGCVVGLYKDPLGGPQTLLSILSVDTVEPTPFQRDVSDAHHKLLANVINKAGRSSHPKPRSLSPAAK